MSPTMRRYLAEGAQLECSFGSAPAALAVTPRPLALRTGGPALATVADAAPVVNIPPFGLCRAPTNPQVIAATAAAMGALTPVPCVPVIPAPWAPGASLAKLQGVPLATSSCTCACAWAGVVTVRDPGQSRAAEP